MKKTRMIFFAVVVFAMLTMLFGCGKEHSEYIKSQKDPTCVRDGYVEKACDCGCGYYELVTVPKLGHSFGEYRANGDKTDTYLGTETATCLNCSATDTRERVEHECSFVYYGAVSEATCVADGVDMYQCVYCSATEERTVEGTAFGHSMVLVEAREADCLVVGWYEYEYCMWCEESTYEEIPAQSHQYVEGVCAVCHRVPPSQGLTYSLSQDGTTATLVNYLNCTDDVIVVSHEYQGAPVTGIELRVGEHFGAKSIFVPSTVTSVSIDGEMVFENLYIENFDNWFLWGGELSAKSLYVNGQLMEHITVPDYITVLPQGLFADFETLRSVHLNQVERLPDYAFANCSGLSELQFGQKLHTIGAYAFSNCGLTEIVVPDTVTAMGSAFVGSLTVKYVKLPAGLLSIPTGMFSGCVNLEEVVLPQGLMEIGRRAFYDCQKLTSITLPAELKIIGKEAFANCDALESVTLPDSVESIGAGCFTDCDKLTAVEMFDRWTVTEANAGTVAVEITSLTDAATKLTATYLNYQWTKR